MHIIKEGEGIMKDFKLTRRSFLKATAIGGITTAISGSFKSNYNKAKAAGKTADTADTKIIRTCCRGCIGKCGILAHMKNGRLIKLEGDPDQPMTRGAVCAKGLAGIQALYNPNRNKYPMLRVGERGENKWKRISWDEAIDMIAKKLMETREKYGAEAVLGTTGGGGNPEFGSVRRFANVFGSPNWFEPGAQQCYMPRTVAYNLVYGQTDMFYQTTSIADSEAHEIYFYKDTPMKSLVLWGTCPAFDSPSQGGRAVVELRAKGVKTVVIDPRLTADASKADVWLPIRPGTDVALMLAWLRYIIKNNLYDKEFVTNWSNLPFLVNPQTKLCLRESDIVPGGNKNTYMIWDKKTQSAQPAPYPMNNSVEPALDGCFDVNGMECKTGFQILIERCEEWTLQKAAEVCWLDPDMIEKAIRIYTDNTPGGISLGVATDQTVNSVQAGMAACSIDLIMGNVQKPGALLQNFGDVKFGDSSINPLHFFLPKEQLLKRLGGIEYKAANSWASCHNPTVLQAILTEKPYPIRVWLERSGNKLSALGNASSWVDALKKLDFIVHMYMYPTSFSMYADLLLPTTEWLETDYVVPPLNMLFVRQAVTHTYETMNETVIWAKIAKRCGELGHQRCKDSFDPAKTAPEQPYWESTREFLDYQVTRKLGFNFEELCKRVPYEAMPIEKWRKYYTYKEIDPKTGMLRGFGTPSKRVEIYGERFVVLGRTGKPFSLYELPPASKDYDPLPYYMEPGESPLDKEVAKEYPLVMTSGRLPFFHHGTLRNIPWIREIYPVPELLVNPTDAKQYGISQGDWVNIASKRGQICAKAWVTQGIAKGVVFMERFWNPETLDTKTHGWTEMNVNILTKNDPPYNDMMGTTTLRGFQVKIWKKTDGAPKGIWTKPEDFKPWLPSASDPTKNIEKEV